MVGLFENYNPIQRIASNQHGPSVNKITRGSLISFHYPQSYVKKLLTNYGGKNFSYFNVRNDKYMANAFRMYVRMGVRQPKRLDTEWLMTVLASVRSFGPGEIEQIRLNIQKQIQQRLQVKANELTSYDQWRNQLTKSQQNQLNSKSLDAQNIITGGYDNNLIKQPPNQNTTNLDSGLNS